jgi:hypothetical protein
MIVEFETVIAWAPRSLSVVLDMANTSGRVWSSQGAAKDSRSDPDAEPQHPRWRARRFHDELLKLGAEITESTVGKYMVRHRQTAFTELADLSCDQVQTMVSVDLFTVPTIRFEILHVFLVLVHERTPTERTLR